MITSSPCKGDKVYCVGDLQFVLQKAEHAIPKSKLFRYFQNKVAPLCTNVNNDNSRSKGCNTIEFKEGLNFEHRGWSKQLLHGEVYNVLVRNDRQYFYFYNGPSNDDLTNHLLQLGYDKNLENQLFLFVATPAYQALLDSNNPEPGNKELPVDFWKQYSSFSEVKIHPIHWDDFHKPLNTEKPLQEMFWPISAYNKKTNKKMCSHSATISGKSQFELISNIGHIELNYNLLETTICH